MESWMKAYNLPQKNCRLQFCDVEKMISKKGTKYDALNFEGIIAGENESIISWFIPSFKILGANIKKTEILNYKGKVCDITYEEKREGYLLNFL